MGRDFIFFFLFFFKSFLNVSLAILSDFLSAVANYTHQP